MDVQSHFNYYDILEVSPHCAQNEVTTAYERLKATYSGENPAIYTIFSEEEARSMLSLVEEAFAVLGNKSRRNLYDEQLSMTANKRSSEPEPMSAKAKALDIPKKSVFVRPTYTVDSAFEIEIQNCHDWPGEMLKKVRLYKGWKVESLAELTKISGYYITGIEALDPKSLPAPVFVRGYVAQLCKVLGLDEKRVCDSYMKYFKNKLEQKS